MNQKRIRGPRFYHEYEYDAETKDQIEDLLTKYPNPNDIITKGIEALHEKHFGSATKGTPPPSYSQTFTGEDDTANQKLDELWHFIQQVKGLVPEQATQGQNSSTAQPIQASFTEEANEKILEKIDELGMKFSKIVSDSTVQKATGKTQITAEMSNEEVLQLIKRIDKLESKLTKAISQSRVAMPSSASPSRRPMKDFGEPPKIGEIKEVDGKPAVEQDRPLLEDVLDTVIVSIEDE